MVDDPSFPDGDEARAELDEELGQEFDLDAILGQVGQPRDHHYVFAHVALSGIALRLDPKNVDLQGLAKSDLFRDLWAEVGERVAAESGGQRLPDAGLAASYIEDGEVSVVVVTLPEAQEMSEAIAVAIVRHPIKRLWFFKGYALRYLTLELGFNIRTEDMTIGDTRTVLCEWTPDRSHLNMGDGPAPEDFGAKVLQMCQPP